MTALALFVCFISGFVSGYIQRGWKEERGALMREERIRDRLDNLGDRLLAQRIEARSDETPQAVQPEGREPGSEGMRPERGGIETEQE